ncbi:MAG: peptidase, partial [Gemmatimonadetes bacterium]|nr:peptidase [Gemmatimonadota bacterium]
MIASRPLYATPEAARASNRPIVYVQGNIHAGEIEGKEALQALLRDLLASPAKNVLDSIVLIAVPIYNGDGNE